MSVDVPYVMTPPEITCGHVFGTSGHPPRHTEPPHPREALEEVVLPALRRAPCGVAFSGGRDSSLVLAVATHVARREGLPDPIPITLVFADAPATDEREWQELVVRHLALQEWTRIQVGSELDIVGEVAQRRLREHGVLWPTTLSRDAPLVDVVRGGSLLDGDGGDEVLGDATHRIAPLAHVVRYPRPIRRRRLTAAIAAVGPARMRIARVHRFWNTTSTAWLRPAGRELLLDALSEAERTRPLWFDTSVRQVPIARHHVLALRNRSLLARRHDVEIHIPLVHPHVIAALARHGGRLGPGDRTASLRSIAPDLLPDELLARRTKADFTDAYLGRPTREFAATWDGSGVDPEFVDAGELRRMWVDGAHHALTTALLQQAWLAMCGDRVTP